MRCIALALARLPNFTHRYVPRQRTWLGHDVPLFVGAHDDLAERLMPEMLQQLLQPGDPQQPSVARIHRQPAPVEQLVGQDPP